MSFPQNGGNRPVPSDELVPTLNPAGAPPVGARSEQVTVSSSDLAALIQSQAGRQAKDRAQYVRQQKGHSWILEWCVLGIFTLWIRPTYFAFSPNHYFHI